MPPALTVARGAFALAAKFGTGFIVKDVVATFSPSHHIVVKACKWATVAALTGIVNEKIEPAAKAEFDGYVAAATDANEAVQKYTAQKKS